MSRTGALLLIAAGSIAGMYVYLVPASDTSDDLAEITRISAAPDREDRRDAVIRTFVPTPAAFSEVIPDAPDEPAAVSPAKPGTWTAVVTSGQAVLSPLKSSRAADPQTRFQLARDLQRGLQRAGCYQGQVTGSWNAGTRRAMGAFLDRANAVLPIKEPDYVLLALVQNHPEISCAAACPSGQAFDDGGRCVPEAIIAQASRTSQRFDPQQLAQAQSPATSDPSQREVLPWQRNQIIAVPLGDVATAQRRPPPGMMSIGGPVDLSSLGTSETLSARAQTSQDTTASGAGAGVSGNDGNALAETAGKVAALQADPDSDSLLDDTSATGDAPPPAAEAVAPSHKSHRSDSERGRRHDSYASAGRRRHGDPRPGTTRFNLMQSLGGIY